MIWTRTAGVLPWPQVDHRLHASRTVWLATTGPDSRPHVAPVWFRWDGHRVTFTTSMRTRKGRNLSHDGRVVLHLGDGDEVVILEGVAVPVTDATLLEDLQRAYGEKYPQPVTGEPALLNPTADHRRPPGRARANHHVDLRQHPHPRRLGPDTAAMKTR